MRVRFSTFDAGNEEALAGVATRASLCSSAVRPSATRFLVIDEQTGQHNQLAVSLKVTEAPPSANCSCAVTVTVPLVEGSVRVTDAVPEEFVVAITLVPLVVPFESVPAMVVNRMPAPVLVNPDGTEVSITASD